MEKINCVYLAAGVGKRLGTDMPKQLVRIGGKPIMLYSLEKLVSSKLFNKIIITYVGSVINNYENIISKYFVDKIEIVYVKGGKTRQESVYNTLDSINSNRVLIHEASRPFLTRNLLNKVLHIKAQVVVPVINIPFTVAAGKEKMTHIFNRDILRNIQLPQVFDTKVLKDSHQKARNDNFVSTDDSTIAFNYGYDVRFIQGEETNIKITTPNDLLLAERILFSRDISFE